VSPTLEVWFEFASTYSYPAIARVEDVARAAGVDPTWRPFLLGPIFQSQGWSDSPFNLYPAKGRYMWRDLERLAASGGIPFRRPSVFPRNGVLAARVALLAADEGWCGPFARAVYAANFAEDRDIGAREVIGAVLAQLGRDPGDVFARAEEPQRKLRLREQTARAGELGIFGAPSFVTRGELFWGNDRLEQALAWSRGGESTVPG
jgi:2-hydroxychromene-2-carboxylate isomerase